MSHDTDGPHPGDVLQVAQRALQGVNELEEELEKIKEQDIRATLEEYDEVVERLTALEYRLSEIDEETDYRDLSQDTKIGMVREHAFRKAVNGHGKATLTYDDVMWEVFDGQPGNNQCYRLLRLAAGYDNDGDDIQDVPGFKLVENTRPMKLKVDAAEAKQGVAFSSRNNPDPTEVR